MSSSSVDSTLPPSLLHSQVTAAAPRNGVRKLPLPGPCRRLAVQNERWSFHCAFLTFVGTRLQHAIVSKQAPATLNTRLPGQSPS